MKTGTFVLALSAAVIVGGVVTMIAQEPMPRTPQEALQRVKLQGSLYWAQAQQMFAERTGAMQHMKSSITERSQATPQSANNDGFSQATDQSQTKLTQQAQIAQAEADRLKQAASHMDRSGQAVVGKLSAFMEDQSKTAQHNAELLGQAGDVTKGR